MTSIIDEILERMDNDPWHIKLKRKISVWWPMIVSNRIAWIRIWFHKKKLKEDIKCENCNYFCGFVFYVDSGDCYNDESENEDIVKIWHKCEKFEKRIKIGQVI